MMTTPRVERRPEQPYAAVRALVPVPFGNYLLQIWSEVQTWLKNKGITSTGPAIIRYLTADMTQELTIEVGYELDSAVQGDDRITAGALPAGHYALLLYTGPYEDEGLLKASAAMIEWGRVNDILWKTHLIDQVEWWEARLERYLVSPEQETDPEKWQTELAFLLVDM